jgi:antirestriction protein ArdC
MKTKTNRKQQKSESELQSRPEPLRNQKAKAGEKASLYQAVTDRIIASLKAGVIPWEKPWKTTSYEGDAFPRNFRTGRPYRGINILLLWGGRFSSPFWLTYRQAQELGGAVRKGEKGTQIVFWKQLDGRKAVAADAEKEKERPPFVLCHYIVFNVEQCEGLKLPEVVASRPTVDDDIAACEALVASYKNGPALVRDNEHESRAFYRKATDSVHMPLRSRFVNAPHYYCTLFHELVHSTGHESRLARTFGERFGDTDYSREELVAEMGAAFLCAMGGVACERMEQNTCAYLQGWIEKLERDNRLIFQAAAKAQSAVDWMIWDTASEAVKTPCAATAA